MIKKYAEIGMSDELRQEISAGKQKFEDHLQRIESLASDYENNPLLDLVPNKSYTLQELSDILQWPVEEGLAIFLHDLRSTKKSLLSVHKIKLEREGDVYIIKTKK